MSTVPNWDERFRGETYVYGTDPNDFLRSMAGRIPKGDVLSLAEGEGRNAVYLAERGYSVTAVDQSSVGLEKAQRLAASRGGAIKTIAADLSTFSIAPGNWDGIVSIFCHVPREVRRRLHAQVALGLRPGGLFLLEAYRPAQLQYKTGGPSTADLLPTLAELKEELAGLTLLHAVETERDVVEGTFHTGRAAVVQIVAAMSQNH